MASAFWYAAKGKWYGRYIDVKGRHAQAPVPGQRKHVGPKAPTARGSMTEKLAEEWAAGQEGKAEAQRNGALPMPEENQTFDWMVSFHARVYGVNLKSHKADSFYEKHLRDCSLSRLTMREVKLHHVREYLEGKKAELSGESVRKLRVRIYQLIALAAEKGYCAHHVKRAPRPDLDEQPDEYLRFEEVVPTFEQLLPKHRGLFWTVILLGFRRQEPLWMLKTDVNVAERTLLARKTKNGKKKTLPIPPPLWPVIQEALKTPGPYLFPDPSKDGGQYNLESDFDRRLRAAMARAGVVKAYRHVCRRKGCGFKEERPTDVEARCPRCDYRLSAYGIPRHVRFHDLRHTTGTLLAKLKVPIEVISTILGHADIAMTRRYLGVDLDDMREGLERLTDRLELGVPGEAPPESIQVHAATGTTAQFATLMLSASEGTQMEARDSEFTSVESRASVVGARGFEPPTPCAQGNRAGFATGVHQGPPQRFSSGMRGVRKSTGDRETPGRATPFALLMLSASDRLLTVKQVAAALQVCTATVYALCKRGELAHSRVLDSIRVERADLEAFLDRARFEASRAPAENRATTAKPEGEE